MERILVIEDHKKLLHSLQRGLTAAGYEVVIAESGEAGFYYASTESFDALVLDVMLPGRDGLEVLQDLRKRGFLAPVLILSARTSVADRVRGLEIGADDYLIKPFAFEELRARLRVQLSRKNPGRSDPLTVCDLQLNVETHRVTRAGRELELSKQEYQLLEYLVRHKDTAVSREAIRRDVWRDHQSAATNVVDVCINSLRKKVERPELRKLIHTVRGTGYAVGDDPTTFSATR